MKTMKVFPTAEVDEIVFDYISILNFKNARYWSYHIGDFVKEAEGEKGYNQEDVAKSKIADDWFIENGAQDGEVILLEQS